MTCYIKGEYRPRVSENRILGRLFGPENNEEIGGCRKIRNEELYNLQPSPNIRMVYSSRMRWLGIHQAKGRWKMILLSWLKPPSKIGFRVHLY